MKYAIYSCLVILVALLLGIGIVLLVRFAFRKKLRFYWNALIVVGTTLTLSAATFFIYLLPYSHAEASVEPYLVSDAKVEVAKVGHAYSFDGPGKDSALILYPGAKVDTKAYAPLCRQIAEGGTDVFLLDMPFHFALLGKDRAGEITASFTYPRFYIGGHSLGGNVASSYLMDHPSDFAGLVLLASYPTAPIPSALPLLSIYGDKDGVLERDPYEKGKSYWSEGSQELVIEGGNHANFARYGKQQGDNDATISNLEQEKRTAEAILSFTTK